MTEACSATTRGLGLRPGERCGSATIGDLRHPRRGAERSTACRSCRRCSSTAGARSGLAARRQDVRRRRRRAAHAQRRAPRRTPLRRRGPRRLPGRLPVFWKEAWLERAERRRATATGTARRRRARRHSSPRRSSRDDASRRGRDGDPLSLPGHRDPAAPRRRCASGRSTSTSATCGTGAGKVLRGLLIEAFNLWQAFSRAATFPKACGSPTAGRYPFVRGHAREGETPSAKLDLRPGELVRIKSKEEIVATLDDTNHNRGLSFDGEMAHYCGRTARVRGARQPHHRGADRRDDRDQVGLHHPRGRRLHRRLLPLLHARIYSYWREIWLERVDEPTLDGAALCRWPARSVRLRRSQAGCPRRRRARGMSSPEGSRPTCSI